MEKQQNDTWKKHKAMDQGDGKNGQSWKKGRGRTSPTNRKDLKIPPSPSLLKQTFLRMQPVQSMVTKEITLTLGENVLWIPENKDHKDLDKFHPKKGKGQPKMDANTSEVHNVEEVPPEAAKSEPMLSLMAIPKLVRKLMLNHLFQQTPLICIILTAYINRRWQSMWTLWNPQYVDHFGQAHVPQHSWPGILQTEVPCQSMQAQTSVLEYFYHKYTASSTLPPKLGNAIEPAAGDGNWRPDNWYPSTGWSTYWYMMLMRVV